MLDKSGGCKSYFSVGTPAHTGDPDWEKVRVLTQTLEGPRQLLDLAQPLAAPSRTFENPKPRGRRGLRSGQHPNHFRDPASATMGAQSNHQI